MAKGASKISGGGGGGGTAKANAQAKAKLIEATTTTTKKATDADNRNFRYNIRNALNDSNYNINKALPDIRSAMKSAPVGTRIEVDAFQSSAGMTQNVFVKRANGTWQQTWRIKGGQIYWTADASAADIFNAFNM